MQAKDMYLSTWMELKNIHLLLKQGLIEAFWEPTVQTIQPLIAVNSYAPVPSLGTPKFNFPILSFDYLICL